MLQDVAVPQVVVRDTVIVVVVDRTTGRLALLLDSTRSNPRWTFPGGWLRLIAASESVEFKNKAADRAAVGFVKNLTGWTVSVTNVNRYVRPDGSIRHLYVCPQDYAGFTGAQRGKSYLKTFSPKEMSQLPLTLMHKTAFTEVVAWLQE